MWRGFWPGVVSQPVSQLGSRLSSWLRWRFASWPFRDAGVQLLRTAGEPVPEARTLAVLLAYTTAGVGCVRWRQNHGVGVAPHGGLRHAGLARRLLSLAPCEPASRQQGQRPAVFLQATFLPGVSPFGLGAPWPGQAPSCWVGPSIAFDIPTELLRQHLCQACLGAGVVSWLALRKCWPDGVVKAGEDDYPRACMPGSLLTLERGAALVLVR